MSRAHTRLRRRGHGFRHCGALQQCPHQPLVHIALQKRPKVVLVHELKRIPVAVLMAIGMSGLREQGPSYTTRNEGVYSYLCAGSKQSTCGPSCRDTLASTRRRTSAGTLTGMCACKSVYAPRQRCHWLALFNEPQNRRRGPGAREYAADVEAREDTPATK